MKGTRFFIIVVFVGLLNASCDKPNNLTEYSKTDSDEALYVDAKKKMDKEDWDGAISILTTKLSTEYQSRTDVKESLMHSYGGKCGISFFELINNLKNMPSSNMFEMAMRLFVGTNVDVASCDNAINVLHSLGDTAATRTSNQNMFAAILGLTRMGVTLHSKLDTDFSGLGDGDADVGADFCTDSSAALHLSDADINRIATGVGLLFENVAALGDQITGGVGDAFDDARELCETAPITLPVIGTPKSHDSALSDFWTDYGLPASPTYQDFGLPADIQEPFNCFMTKDAQVTPKMRRLFRRMLGDNDIGYGGCSLTTNGISLSTSLPKAQFVVSMNCCPGLTKP